MSLSTVVVASVTAVVQRQLRAWGLEVTANNVALYTTLKASHRRHQSNHARAQTSIGSKDIQAKVSLARLLAL